MSRLLAVLLLAGSVVAQQAGAPNARVHHMLPCATLARYDPQPPADGAPAAVARLAHLLRLVLQTVDGKPMTGTVQVGKRAGGDVIVVFGRQDKIDIAKAAHAQLEVEAPLRARVQCALLTLPKALAAQHGLAATEARRADDTAVALLTRHAVKNGGTLQNLAELTMSPLTAVTADAGGKLDATRRELRLAAEMIPLAADRVAIAFDLVRRLPATAEQADPSSTWMNPLVEVQADAATMVPVPRGDVVDVLIVRCLELAPAPLSASPAAPARGR